MGSTTKGNLISGNATFGVLLDFAVATEEPVQIADNRIGVGETGKALPNDVGVRVNKGNAQLTGDTIAHNLGGGLAVIDPASTVSVTRSPFFTNGLRLGLGPQGIVHATQPFNAPMQLAALKSPPDASGQVSMVFALPKLGDSTNGGLPAAPGEKVTIEFYANDGLAESQGRYPLFVREIDPTKAWSERFVVSPSSLMATKATFTVTLTRRGKTSEFSSRTVRETFVWPELLIAPSKPGEITLAWPSGGKPGLFVLQESSLLDSGASFVLREVTPKLVNGALVVTKAIVSSASPCIPKRCSADFPRRLASVWRQRRPADAPFRCSASLAPAMPGARARQQGEEPTQRQQQARPGLGHPPCRGGRSRVCRSLRSTWSGPAIRPSSLPIRPFPRTSRRRCRQSCRCGCSASRSFPWSPPGRPPRAAV
ncbi:MAG: hypothetical protein O3C21_02950 [Verrucomicrobia bacterium]|nr:hypothetical protein [Verrucomicrobiota bacterium]